MIAKKPQLALFLQKKLFLVYLVVFSVVILDQIIKVLVQGRLTVVCNTSVAFGLPIGSNFLWIIICLVVVAFLASRLFVEKNQLLKFSFALTVGGGVSNLIDRLAFGCVRDFINIGWWPSFNLADTAITVGILTLVITVFRRAVNERSI